MMALIIRFASKAMTHPTVNPTMVPASGWTQPCPQTANAKLRKLSAGKGRAAPATAASSGGKSAYKQS